MVQVLDYRNVLGLALIGIATVEYFRGSRARNRRVQAERLVLDLSRQRADTHYFNQTNTRTGQKTTYKVNLWALATEIHDALHANVWEDEKAVILALKRITPRHMPRLAAIYAELFNINLRSDIIKYFSSSQLAQIREYINAI